MSTPNGNTHTVLSHFRHAIFDYLLAGQIGFVTDEKFVDTLRRVSVNLLEPLLDVGESVYSDAPSALLVRKPICRKSTDRCRSRHKQR